VSNLSSPDKNQHLRLIIYSRPMQKGKFAWRKLRKRYGVGIEANVRAGGKDYYPIPSCRQCGYSWTGPWAILNLHVCRDYNTVHDPPRRRAMSTNGRPIRVADLMTACTQSVSQSYKPRPTQWCKQKCKLGAVHPFFSFHFPPRPFSPFLLFLSSPFFALFFFLTLP